MLRLQLRRVCLRSDSTESFSIERLRRKRGRREEGEGGGGSGVSASLFNEFIKCTFHFACVISKSRGDGIFLKSFPCAYRISS